MPAAKAHRVGQEAGASGGGKAVTEQVSRLPRITLSSTPLSLSSSRRAVAMAALARSSRSSSPTPVFEQVAEDGKAPGSAAAEELQKQRAEFRSLRRQVQIGNERIKRFSLFDDHVLDRDVLMEAAVAGFTALILSRTSGPQRLRRRRSSPSAPDGSLEVEKIVVDHVDEELRGGRVRSPVRAMAMVPRFVLETVRGLVLDRCAALPSASCPVRNRRPGS